MRQARRETNPCVKLSSLVLNSFSGLFSERERIDSFAWFVPACVVLFLVPLDRLVVPLVGPSPFHASVGLPVLVLGHLVLPRP